MALNGLVQDVRKIRLRWGRVIRNLPVFVELQALAAGG